MPSTTRDVGIFVAGLAIGVAIPLAWFLAPNFGTTASNYESQGSTTPQETEDMSGTVSVTTQSAGREVVVDSVTVPPPGVWVAVKDVRGQDLGNTLGAARAFGPRSSFTIPLLRSTVAGQQYAVVLYRDDGDGKFSLEHDSIYVDFDTGKPVIAHFTTKS